MDNLVYFNVQKKTVPHAIDLLCVYLPDSFLMDKAEFISAIAFALTKCDTIPDGIVIYYSKNLKEEIIDAWNDDVQKEILFSRLTNNRKLYTKFFYFVNVTNQGFAINDELSSTNGVFEPSDSDFRDFYKKGIASLAEKNDIVHSAPSGHKFKHPSGRILNLFIQAKEIACNEAELQFIARGLCLIHPQISWSELESVYIDSMGIYSLVKEALTFSNSQAVIENFHSYEGIDKLIPPTELDVAIISASTSGSMASILIDKGFDLSRIITLIDTDSKEKSSLSLVTLGSGNDILKKDNSLYNYETEIELVGEQFTYKAKPPKQITISFKHEPDALKEILNTFAIDGVNGINERLETINKTPLISLRPENLLKCSRFNKWLEDELRWSLSSSVNLILYKDDGASYQLVERVRDIIKDIRDSNEKISILEASELDDDALKNCKGVLIISAFCGDGGDLRQISRDLREFEDRVIPRHFLIGVGIPQSNSAWKKLRLFLIKNATKRDYEFSVWNVLPLGPDIISNSWAALPDYLSKVQVEDRPTHEGLSETDIDNLLDDMDIAITSSFNRLLPKTNDEDLQLTPGFVFFNDKFDDELDKINQSVILMTISSVLQAAREYTEQDLCLSPSNYQSVVLSPENFLRFNDDILQACILRASLPSELDYRSNADLSLLMSEFLFKVFSRHDHPFGFAALEFAAALSTGKLQLRKEHCIELVNKTLSIKPCDQRALAGFMLSIKSRLN
ncbi:hypothetical protein SAMN05518863_103327 [Candidatus Pantoea symbiotica]|uniref:SIR2-like domain-containing protein n=1 Tax=Candidatus Pantoea symbiotica TaxID=1884370 RepID=A0A1I3VDD0_9GAMM|nr:MULTISPECIES: hypothetical protein [Pantoea]SFJ92207.1 hypothetical protein SAMN05518863_103327 [Pantoea symbiotica]SFU63991.1 hypothetical protein SAMN05518864_103327 [Pantoea sp. YR525]